VLTEKFYNLLSLCIGRLVKGREFKCSLPLQKEMSLMCHKFPGSNGASSCNLENMQTVAHYGNRMRNMLNIFVNGFTM
jgi:hypothetical protein